MSSRVWVITGANSGLGLALSLHAASHDHRVIGTVRSLSKFSDRLRNAGVQPLVVDFSSTDEALAKAAKEALQIYGHVDVLVNNAGYSVLGPVEELQLSDIRSQFQTNVFGLIAFTQPFIAHMRTRHAGHIVNISSIGSMNGIGGWGAYCASKAAIDAFTDSLHNELKLFGVRVLCVLPGYFSSSFFDEHRAILEADLSGQSTIYTDPETQGYNAVNRFPQYHVEQRQIGDPEKFAQRIFEVVTGTGLAENLAARYTADGKWEGSWELNRVLLGPDCGAILESRLDILKENLWAYKPIWKSTDVEEQRLKDFSRG